mgnify:CR=1 FL=1
MDLNIDLKNLNVQDIKEKILAIADKKTLIKFGISFGAIVFFLIIYYAILNPIVNKKKIQLDDMNLKNQEIVKFTQDIKVIEKKIKKLTPEYENYSTLFHTRAEVEGLYQTLSEHAGANGLVISKIVKKNPKQVSKAEALAKAEGNKKKKKKATKQKKGSNTAAFSQITTFTYISCCTFPHHRWSSRQSSFFQCRRSCTSVPCPSFRRTNSYLTQNL